MMCRISPCEYTGFLKCLWKTKNYFFLRKLEFSPGFGTILFQLSLVCVYKIRKPYWFTLFSCSISLPSSWLVPKYQFSLRKYTEKDLSFGSLGLESFGPLESAVLTEFPPSLLPTLGLLTVMAEWERAWCCASTAQQQLKHCCVIDAD